MKMFLHKPIVRCFLTKAYNISFAGRLVRDTYSDELFYLLFCIQRFHIRNTLVSSQLFSRVFPFFKLEGVGKIFNRLNADFLERFQRRQPLT